MNLEKIESRAAELIEELGQRSLKELRKMAGIHKIKGYNMMRKADLVTDLSAAIAVAEMEQAEAEPVAEPVPDPVPVEADPEMQPGYYSRQDVVERVSPERLDPHSDAGKVYLRWDPNTMLIRALKDGKLVHPHLTQSCENIPPGNNYDKLAGYLRKRCMEAGYEVADDWDWSHEQLRDHTLEDTFLPLEPAITTLHKVVYENADFEEGWDDERNTP